MPRRLLAGVAIAGSLLTSGCAPVIEAAAIPLAAHAGITTYDNYGPASAHDTVFHVHKTLKLICIEHNPGVAVPDFVTSVQAELETLRIESRVYQYWMQPSDCEAWLRYSGTAQWAVGPDGKTLTPYLSGATLSLYELSGALISTSSYRYEDDNHGKFSSTRRKVRPVVKAIITGEE